MTTKISSLLSVACLLLVILGCGQLVKQTRKDLPDISITVEQLASEYKSNPSAASSKYQNKTLAVTGTVDTKMAGTTLVFKTDDRTNGFIVQCFFDKDGADSYRKIKNGQEVTMLGLCKGRNGDGPLAITSCILR